MARSSKSGWVLYLMVHVPFVWWWKIGITSVGIGAKRRAKNLDRAMPGFPVPVLFVIVPNAYGIEQELHRWFAWFNARFYKGDGASEFFWFPAAAPTAAIMMTVWGVYLWLLDAALGTTILPTLARWFFFGAFDFVEYLCR